MNLLENLVSNEMLTIFPHKSHIFDKKLVSEMQSKVLLANQIAGLSNQPYLEQNDEIVRFFAFCYKFMEIKSYLEIILDHGALKFCCMSRMN